MMKWPFSYPVIGNEGLFVFLSQPRLTILSQLYGEHIDESIRIYL